MAKYIVTGGCGFIGHHLVQGLVDGGHEVLVIDDLSTGKVKVTGVKYIKADCATLKSMPSVDAIFHLAAKPRIPFSWEYPMEAHAANLTGVLNMLRLAVEYGVKKFIYSSSSSVYGSYEDSASEKSTPVNPVSPYGFQKYGGEVYGKMLSAKLGFTFIALRYFNVYGEGMAGGGYATVIQKIIQAKNHRSLFVIEGDGEQRRDFTHVSDVVEANVRAAEEPLVDNYYTVNIGTGTNYSINELVRMIQPKYKYRDARPGDVKQTRANINLAYEVLNWEPQVSLEVGLGQLMKEKPGWK